MNNNKLKTLLKNKQKTISREKGYPGLRSGKDGDLQVRRVEGQGIFLFYKWSNKWYSTRLTQHRPTTAEHKQPVKIPLGVEPSSLGDIAMDSDGLIKVKKSKSNKSQMVSMNTSNLLDIAEIKAERDTTTDMSATASGASDLHLLNKTGYTYMLLETQGSSYDPFIVYGYRQAGESIELKQWITGMDNSNSDTFCIYYKSGDNAPLTPSTTTASHKKFEIDISGNVTTLGTLTIGSVAEIGSDTDKILMSDSGVVKYVTGANLRSYIGAGTSSVAALDDLSDVTYSSGDLTISSLDTIISGALLFDASGDIELESEGRVTIDKNIDDTTGAIHNAFYVDLDRTGTVASGLDDTTAVNINSRVTGASGGTITNTGLIVTAIGDSGGSSTTNGLKVLANSADTNNGIYVSTTDGVGNDFKNVSSADTGDFFSINTSANGATTLATIDDDASAGHLTLDADGQIIIDSVNSAGAVTDGTLFKTSGTTFGSITTHHALSCFTLFEAAGSSTDDYFEIQVDAAGATKFNTIDAGGATAHLTLNPDGDVKFDSDGILIKDNGDVSTPGSGYGTLYVNSDTLYFKDDGGNVSNITAINPIVSAMIFG